MPTITRNFRLDQQLVNDLIELAKKDGRSLNSFVAFRLQEIVASAGNVAKSIHRPVQRPSAKKKEEVPKKKEEVENEPNSSRQDIRKKKLGF